MPSICFYFQVHQPYRLQEVSFFETGKDPDYFAARHLDTDNQAILEKVSKKCYLPTNKLLLEMLNKYPEFKFSFSISGVFLEQIKNWAPDVLTSFQDLAKTGRVEFINETFYHSLAFLYSKSEFLDQITKHKLLIEELFGQTPTTFRNTELIYNNELGNFLDDLGYKAVLTESVDRIMDWRSPNFVYNVANAKNGIKLLLKNYKLSDDIAFRFSNRDWSEFPLSANKFANWIKEMGDSSDIINLFMDFETFGEHQWEDSGIFEFLKDVPEQIIKIGSTFTTPKLAAAEFFPRGEISIPDFISWADSERDLSAWRSNSMQEDSLSQIYKLESRIKNLDNKTLLEDWRKMTTSDHFYYMCTKFWADGDVHKYFSPYSSPYEAYIIFMNCLRDLKYRTAQLEKIENELITHKLPFSLTDLVPKPLYN
jgi:alpha-amylase